MSIEKIIQVKERNPLSVEISKEEIREVKRELSGDFYEMFNQDKPLSPQERYKKFIELPTAKQEIIEKLAIGS